MTLRLDFAAASDRGLVRGNNEDSAYAGPRLLALADGMGGHAAGEIASQIMISHLQVLDADPGDNDMLALLGGMADDANLAIAEHVRQHPETDGMGTTLSALMFNGTTLGLCHVGDSRGYRLRDGILEQLTVDDTFVQSLVTEGKLDPEDVSTHPQRSLILKAYTGRPVDPTLMTLEPRVGDRLLLCSDGLSDPVTHSTIETTLSTGTPAEAATRLVELALRSGGPDNVTVIIADVVEDPNAETTRALQSQPMTVGALNGIQEDEPRPDTAAGRAAAIARRPQTISPSGQSQPQALGGTPEPPAAADEEEDHTPGESSSPSRKLIPLIIVLVLLAALAGGGWWAVKKVQENYYVATAAEDRIGIWKGVNYSVFGRELNEEYQLACINEQGGLKMVSPGDQGDCEPFNLDDLPESTRNSVSGLPSGTYDEVLEQMQRLAGSALPVCVTREGAEAEPAPQDAENSESAAPAAQANSGDRNTPGVDCREVGVR
ncbi:PP2C-family Ser/Thr phosphatase [Corynebacterium occultum]|uniref:PP2C-family Ser/Thr phosphatase n=1 Tax=Corynebacterium occultum TaxID=2675219 RepID=A0A6B8VSI1_9CORY|nr:protein phosphatase 2C domain-containing protein [Corynebacterium occultum]QGU06019.1 PP2C-family Ser/Thr phosphatase [Corynebacterium occultum]